MMVFLVAPVFNLSLQSYYYGMFISSLFNIFIYSPSLFAIAIAYMPNIQYMIHIFRIAAIAFRHKRCSRRHQ